MTSLKIFHIQSVAVLANTCDASHIHNIKSSRYIIKVMDEKQVKLTLIIQPICNQHRKYQ